MKKQAGDLSERAREWVSTQHGLMLGLAHALQHPFDLDTLPHGCINLGTAENDLMWDLLSEKMATSKAWTHMVRTDTRYGNMLGSDTVREALAQFLNHRLRIPPPIALHARQLSVHNGCASALESLFHVLCDHGDGVLLPSPYYGGFDLDLPRRAGVQLVPVPCWSATAYAVTRQALQQSLERAKERGIRVRALLFTNPVNPTGAVYAPTDVQMMAAFCQEHGLHLVADEIYALSVFHPESVTSTECATPPWIDGTMPIPPFQSVLSMDSLAQGLTEGRTHWVWSFSKDFCVSGFRAGVMVSRNPKVVRAVDELGLFTAIPGPMQTLLAEMVTDHAWCDRFFQLNHQRLRESYTFVVQCIQEWNRELGMGGDNATVVRHLPARGGFFIWLDFSYFLHGRALSSEERQQPEAMERERELFQQFLHEAKVYVAPGNLAFHELEAGWFRLVFAQQQAVLQLALDRIWSVLRKQVLPAAVVLAG